MKPSSHRATLLPVRLGGKISPAPRRGPQAKSPEPLTRPSVPQTEPAISPSLPTPLPTTRPHRLRGPAASPAQRPTSPRASTPSLSPSNPPTTFFTSPADQAFLPAPCLLFRWTRSRTECQRRSLVPPSLPESLLFRSRLTPQLNSFTP